MAYQYHSKNPAGRFDERSTNNVFEYRDSEHEWGLSHGLPHEIFVEGGTRAARVLKTVAWVAVDEAADGSPVLERWFIKQHHVYPTH